MKFGRVAQYTIVFTAGFGSLLAGASLVHFFFPPNLTIPVMLIDKKIVESTAK
jgi:predicted Na+-dependent transporter